ncbi:MAG: hypothetical protein WBA70_11910 [Thermodesulfobacteriota bacterium]
MNIFKNIVAGFIFMFVAIIAFSGLASNANAQSCAVEVIKNAVPADNTPFNFTAVVLGQPEPFTLMDPDDNITNVAFGLNESSITENVPQGWVIESIECRPNQGDEALISFSINGPTVTINCLDSFGQGTCVFNNVIATRNVPNLSQWGLIAMAGVLGIVGYMVAKRRKLAA